MPTSKCRNVREFKMSSVRDSVLMMTREFYASLDRKNRREKKVAQRMSLITSSRQPKNKPEDVIISLPISLVGSP